MLNLPACASALQQKGITTLLYDPRSTGSSGGTPRNEIDPPQAVSDMSDALSHLLTLPSVSPSSLSGFFGISFGGAVALTAASVDPRARLVVAVAPLTDMDFSSPAQRTRVLRKCGRDKASRAMGNEPFTVPMIDAQGKNPVGFGRGLDGERYSRIVGAGREVAEGHVNRVTLMTYYKLAMWSPWPLWRKLAEAGSDGKDASRAAMFVIPEKDVMSLPELQREYFEQMEEREGFKKKKLEVEGAEHEGVLGDEYLDKVIGSVDDFIKELAQPS